MQYFSALKYSYKLHLDFYGKENLFKQGWLNVETVQGKDERSKSHHNVDFAFIPIKRKIKIELRA